jgi:putative phage-type endonuclease
LPRLHYSIERRISTLYKKVVSTENMSRDEWLTWRKKGIGGSDASVVCGINKYKSPVELWMDKMGMLEQKEAGEAAYWGNILEPTVREEFSKRTGLKVNIEKSILQHSVYPFMFANVDGIVNDPVHGNCIFEAKTSSIFRIEEWVNSIPEEYQLQIQHYMAVTGFKGAYVAALIGGNQFKWQFIKRDDEIIDMLIKLEESFWEHVRSNTPPPLDGSEAASMLLNRLYPQGNPESKITLPDEALDLIIQYEEYQEKEKQICEQKEKACTKLKALLGENESGVIGSRIVSWKNITSERLDSKQLKSDIPDIYSKYAQQSGYRRFSIKHQTA